MEEVRHELDREGIRLGAYPQSDGLVALGRLQEALQVLSGSSSEESNTAGFDRGPQFDAFRGVVYARLGRLEDAARRLSAAIPAAENPTGLSQCITRSTISATLLDCWGAMTRRCGGSRKPPISDTSRTRASQRIRVLGH